jgi:hypothetical protein
LAMFCPVVEIARCNALRAVVPIPSVFAMLSL